MLGSNINEMSHQLKTAAQQEWVHSLKTKTKTADDIYVSLFLIQGKLSCYKVGWLTVFPLGV